MNLARRDHDLSSVELGVCDLHRAFAELEQCYPKGLKVYESGEEAMTATSFALYRSNQDFIDVACNGVDHVMILSDRVVDNRGFLARLIRRKNTFEIVVTKQQAMQVIEDYFELPRPDFELKYESNLT